MVRPDRRGSAPPSASAAAAPPLVPPPLLVRAALSALLASSRISMGEAALLARSGGGGGWRRRWSRPLPSAPPRALTVGGGGGRGAPPPPPLPPGAPASARGPPGVPAPGVAGDRVGGYRLVRAAANSAVAPAPAAPEGVRGYDDDDWSAYLSAMDEVTADPGTYGRKDRAEDRGPVREYLLSRERVVPTNLPSLSGIPPDCRSEDGDGEDDDDDDGRGATRRTGDRFRSELEAQRAAFLGASGLTLSQHRLALNVLSYMGNLCAKHGTARPLPVAWEKVKEAGIAPRENALSVYLYVMGGAAGCDGGGDEDEGGEGGRCDGPVAEVLREIVTFHDLLFKPTEKTISLRIKLLVARGDARGAEELLRVLPDDRNGGELKLRTYLPILELYCQQGDMGSALKLYKRMRNSPGVIFGAQNYSLLIASVAENGYFRRDSDPIPNAEEGPGRPPASGPALFDRLASEMAEDVLEITPGCALRLRRALEAGFGAAGGPGAGAEATGGEGEGEGAGGEDLAPNNEVAGGDDLVADRVLVDEATALCPRTRARLRLIMLEEDERRRVHDTLLRMSNAQYEAYSAKLEARNLMVEDVTDDYASRHLSRFARWLDEREGKPFTAVVDGANVAFHGQGVINHFKVHLIVDALEKMGENPLVILPKKYTSPKFYIRKGFVQELPEAQLELVKRLQESGKLYTVPKRCLDDYYWMLASVSNQTLARDGADLTVPPNTEGRWPGLRPIVVSNDQMRDHKLELLHPRLFRRWYSSHIIRYELTSFPADEWEREIQFSAADFFSREIQGNPAPLGGSDDVGGTAWHFPVSGWEFNERFCVRLPLH